MAPYKSSPHRELSAERQAGLGRLLARVREESGLTVEELSRLSGVADKHIQRIEAGRSNPTLGTLYSFADALGVEVDRLLP